MQDSFENLLLYLVAGTRGGYTRGMIIHSLLKKPMNAHQVSKAVKVDYKTAEYHLKLLVENEVLNVIRKGSYGAVYIPSPMMKESRAQFDDIWAGFGK